MQGKKKKLVIKEWLCGNKLCIPLQGSFSSVFFLFCTSYLLISAENLGRNKMGGRRGVERKNDRIYHLYRGVPGTHPDCIFRVGQRSTILIILWLCLFYILNGSRLLFLAKILGLALNMRKNVVWVGLVPKLSFPWFLLLVVVNVNEIYFHFL